MLQSTHCRLFFFVTSFERSKEFMSPASFLEVTVGSGLAYSSASCEKFLFSEDIKIPTVNLLGLTVNRVNEVIHNLGTFNEMVLGIQRA